jgi:hypothetical protein
MTLLGIQAIRMIRHESERPEEVEPALIARGSLCERSLNDRSWVRGRSMPLCEGSCALRRPRWRPGAEAPTRSHRSDLRASLRISRGYRSTRTTPWSRRRAGSPTPSYTAKSGRCRRGPGGARPSSDRRRTRRPRKHGPASTGARREISRSTMSSPGFRARAVGEPPAGPSSCGPARRSSPLTDGTSTVLSGEMGRPSSSPVWLRTSESQWS